MKRFWSYLLYLFGYFIVSLIVGIIFSGFNSTFAGLVTFVMILGSFGAAYQSAYGTKKSSNNISQASSDDNVDDSGDAVEIERLKNEVKFLREQIVKLSREDVISESKKQEMKFDHWKNIAETFANFYVNDQIKNLCKKITVNNFESSKQALDRSFNQLEKFNLSFPNADRFTFGDKLKFAFKDAVRKEEARIEQNRIKEQIREEQKAERERLAAIKKAEDEEKAIAVALEKALRESEDKHSEEIEALKKQLEELHLKTERAKSQAELTRSGHVYVISNLGSFGKNYYKVGMTRRLDPMDRVKELGDASVPFPFDVHMMISSDDAPKLESLLHKKLHQHRANKVNLRKEFFKIDLEVIKGLVEENHGVVDYVADPDALEFRETLLIDERGDFCTYYDESEIDEIEKYDEESEEKVA